MDAPDLPLEPEDPLRWQKRAGALLRQSGISVVINADGSCRLNGRKYSCWQLFQLTGFKDRLDLFGAPVPGTEFVGDLRTPEERAMAILQGRGLEVLRWSFMSFVVEGKIIGPWDLYDLAGFKTPADLAVEHPVFRRIDPVIAASYLWNYYGIRCLRQVNRYRVANRSIFPDTLVSMALTKWSTATGHERPFFKVSISGEKVRADLIANRRRLTFREGIHSVPLRRLATKPREAH